MAKLNGDLTRSQYDAMCDFDPYIGQTINVLTSESARSVNPEFAKTAVGGYHNSATLRGLEKKGYIRIENTFWRAASITVLKRSEPRQRMEKLVAKFMILPPDSDISGPHQVDPEKADRLAFAMQFEGQVPPIRAVKYPSGYSIIDGHHRTAGSKKKGLPLPALVVDGEEFEDLDIELRNGDDGKRADDLEFWTVKGLNDRHFEIAKIIRRFANGIAYADGIAHYLGYRPATSGRLSVSSSLRQMQKFGLVGRIPPRDQWDHANYFLTETGKIILAQPEDLS